MEAVSVLSPSSWEKRRAWVRQSRCWRNTAAEEEEAAAAVRDVPELHPPHLDDVFLEGSPSSKIETWLQECGSSVETLPEELGLPGPCGCRSNGTSFEDDLTLGAEALLLPGSNRVTGRALWDKQLHLGHSMASSALSSLTTKTGSSISEVLEWWQEDAEEILYNLGFARSEPGAGDRIPPRFFSAPSRARGIDFQLFLRAQVQRMEMEDPCLMLANRFQQVQALAVTADAFFCLYSYVSRTPVQRISPSRLAWACPDVPRLCAAPPQPSALSPVERLKKAVSSMCLYTPPRDEDSAGGTGWVSPGHPGSTLGTGTQEALGRARGERFRFDAADVLESRQRDGGVPACPHRGGAHVRAWRGGEREPPPRPSPAGTLGDARLERSCPHGGPGGVAPGTRGALCPVTAGRVGVEDAAANVTLSPTAGPHGPHAGWEWVTPEHPQGLGSAGDSGFGSGCWGPSPRRKAGSHGRHPDTLDPPEGHCPDSDTPRAGGPRAQRSRGRQRGGQQGDAAGPRHPGKDPAPPEDSFELEEVPSASEGEDEDGDARDEAVRLLCPSVGIRRSLMLHASSGRSDSSGFVEEPAPASAPAPAPAAPLQGTGRPG